MKLLRILPAALLALHLHVMAQGGAAPAAAPAASGAGAPAPAGGNAGPTLSFEDWGVGLAVVRPEKHAISEASIVGGVVRASAETSNETMILVARHIYPWRDSNTCDAAGEPASSLKALKARLRNCVGVMIGVGLGSSSAAGSGQLINFAGIGLTIGGRPKNADGSASAWHLGIGVGRRFNQTVLGDGFEVNAPPPAGETQVRYKQVDVKAKFIYFTTHW